MKLTKILSLIFIPLMLASTGCASGRSFSQANVGQIEQIYLGTVLRVNSADIKDDGKGTVLGALAGGLAGNQFGPKGSGEKTAATVGGALAGAYAGNEINRDAGQELTIRLDDGREIVTLHRIDQATPYSFRNGDRVKVYVSGSRVSRVLLAGGDPRPAPATPSASPTPSSTGYNYTPNRYAPAQKSAPSGTNLTEQRIKKLKELGQLRKDGILTEEEFQVEKQKILQGP